MIEGLSHITLVVKDLQISARLFVDIFDAKEIYNSGNETFSVAPEKFFLICDLWFCLIQGESLMRSDYGHIAFKIAEDDFERCHEKIKAAGSVILPGRPRVDGEGRSIYFYDYDNHLFELHTGTLAQRLQRYGGVNM